MKKTISLIIVIMMLFASLPLSAFAAEPFGTVIEAAYSGEAPSMAEALPDAGWGEKVIHITKDTPNTGITDYSVNQSGIRCSRDLWMDIYCRWTDSKLYLCLTSYEENPLGDVEEHRGDGFEVNIAAGIQDMSLYNKNVCASRDDYLYCFDTYSFGITFGADDVSMSLAGGAYDIDCALYWDPASKIMAAKYAFDYTTLGYSKKEAPKDGDIFSINITRISAEEGDKSHYTGWLEWGDHYNAEKGFDPNDTALYVPSSMNPDTTESNSIRLVKNSPVTPEPAVTPDTPATPAEAPSSWAAEEVNAAIAEGLVPAELQKNYTKGISRIDLSKMIITLIEKCYTGTMNAGFQSFTDTDDANVQKASAYGIINGYKQADGTYMFKPQNTLKRSEMSAIINRIAKLCGKTTTGFDSEVKFTDTASHWCNAELGYPVHMGIVKGTSETTFSPENTLTVEQTIMMIYRTFKAVK